MISFEIGVWGREIEKEREIEGGREREGGRGREGEGSNLTKL